VTARAGREERETTEGKGTPTYGEGKGLPAKDMEGQRREGEG
jgi:hypothetical protein